jgi:hypothetical protein
MRSNLAQETQAIAGTAADRLPVDVAAFRTAALCRDPFPYVIVPAFIKPEALEAIGSDYPAIEQGGSFPLESLQYGPAFDALIKALSGPEMQAAISEKFGIDLSPYAITATARGISRAKDGKIHTDSRNKLITVLLYMNDSWESDKGRLRLLRSPNDLNDIIEEVPPARGTLLVFRNQKNAWHGFEPFSGPRRVIQVNWVTSSGHAQRETARHRLSAFFKRLFHPA